MSFSAKHLILKNDQALRAFNEIEEAEEILRFNQQRKLQIEPQVKLMNEGMEPDELVSKGYIDDAIQLEADTARAAEQQLEQDLDTAEQAIEANAFNITSLQGSMSSAETEIATVKGRLDLAEPAIADFDIRVPALEASVDTLNADSTSPGSVDYKVAEAVNTILGGAPEAFDTLKEIADYIASDEGAGSAIVGRVGVLETKVETLEGDATVVNSVAYKIAAEADLREGADSALAARLDVVEGSGEGSVAKAEQDAKDYADGLMSTEVAAREAADLLKATKELNNLQNVAINSALLPDNNAARDLGSSAKRWRDIYASSTLRFDGGGGMLNDNFTPPSGQGGISFAIMASSSNVVVSSTTTPSTLGSKDVRIETGNAVSETSGNSGNIVLQTGTSVVGERGTITLDAKEIQFSGMVLKGLGEASASGEAVRYEQFTSGVQEAKDYADTKVAALVGSAPEVLDTLQELSAALGGDANFATTIAGQIGGLGDRLDVLEGGAEVEGSVAKQVADALASANSYTDSAVAGIESNKEIVIFDSGHISNQYVDLAHEILPETLIFISERVLMIEDEDYTVSVVGGVTRISFIGPVATGGLEEFVAGDKVIFQYLY